MMTTEYFVNSYHIDEIKEKMYNQSYYDINAEKLLCDSIKEILLNYILYNDNYDSNKIDYTTIELLVNKEYITLEYKAWTEDINYNFYINVKNIILSKNYKDIIDKLNKDVKNIIQFDIG